MKFLLSILFASGIKGSHFRAVSYNVIRGADGNLQVSRTLAFTRSNSGYSSGCTPAHVANKTPSSSQGTETCVLKSGGSCGTITGSYIVTDIEDQLSSANNYCYGYKSDLFKTPSGPFTISWGSSAWVSMTGDNGGPAGGGSYGFIATVNDVNNNSPQVKIPPLWKVLAGCPSQTLALTPVDLDNDVVKCRWGTSLEAQGAVHSSAFGSLSLDEDKCVVTYDGTKDSITSGVKPIAIQVEDYDSNGKIRSSMPVQLLATVWTPSSSNFNARMIAMHGPGNVVQIPDLFPTEDDDDDEKIESVRRRRSGNIPAYCSIAPTLVSPSPAAGAVIAVPVLGITIKIKATSQNGAITRFVYNSPIGTSCSKVDGSGAATCVFKPTTAQQSQMYNFCFLAEDGAGMSSERRCVTFAVGIKTTTTTTTTPEPAVSRRDLISTMILMQHYGMESPCHMSPNTPIGWHTGCYSENWFMQQWLNILLLKKFL